MSDLIPLTKNELFEMMHFNILNWWGLEFFESIMLFC